LTPSQRAGERWYEATLSAGTDTISVGGRSGPGAVATRRADLAVRCGVRDSGWARCWQGIAGGARHRRRVPQHVSRWHLASLTHQLADDDLSSGSSEISDFRRADHQCESSGDHRRVMPPPASRCSSPPPGEASSTPGVVDANRDRHHNTLRLAPGTQQHSAGVDAAPGIERGEHHTQ